MAPVAVAVPEPTLLFAMVLPEMFRIHALEETYRP